MNNFMPLCENILISLIWYNYMERIEMSEYKSDYEKTVEMYKNSKTEGFGGKHNLLANDSGDYKNESHEHLGYNPKTGESFWHGKECKTRNNKP